MKGVILAGGTGTRLLPLTKVTNKHLLPVGKKPMIYYPIERMVSAGITDIIIISGTAHMGDIFQLLGSGRDFGCNFTYRVQDESDGIGGALRLCKNFVGDDSCLTVLGDNIFEFSLAEQVSLYESEKKSGCVLFMKSVSDPHRYGVASLDDNGKLLKIIEKPEITDSNLCVTGIYIYDSSVFDLIEHIKPSARGELEVTDINNRYIEMGKASFCVLTGEWTDAGTWDSYKHANNIFYGSDQ